MRIRALVIRQAAVSAVAVSAAVLLAACNPAGQPARPGGSAGAPGSKVTVTVTAPPGGTHHQARHHASARPAARRKAIGCATSYLSASVGRTGEAAGSSYYPIQLTNISSRTCTMYGYPGVSLVTAVHGANIGSPAQRDPDSPKALVTLAPGATASALLQVADVQNYPAAKCRPVTAQWLEVYPPGQFAPLFYGFSVPTCAAARQRARVLSISPMVAGRTGR